MVEFLIDRETTIIENFQSFKSIGAKNDFFSVYSVFPRIKKSKVFLKNNLSYQSILIKIKTSRKFLEKILYNLLAKEG